MYVLKDELDNYEEKFEKNYEDFLPKKPYLEPVQLVRIRIRPGQKAPDANESGSTTLQKSQIL
jgi:hypothetical protein